MFEAWRHHPGDLHTFSVQLNYSSHDVGVAGKAPSPEPITENNDVVTAGIELFSVEDAAVCWINAEEWKEIGSRCQAEQPFRSLALLRQIPASEGVGCHLLEHCVLLTLIEEVPGRMRPRL